jgi:2,5-diketo-D-gluconate reductase A
MHALMNPVHGFMPFLADYRGSAHALGSASEKGNPVLTTETFTLNNGVELPKLGFGVFQTPPDETAVAVEEALRVGYRHIDTAAGYANERGVGEGFRRSGLARGDVFIETKIWITDYGYEETLHSYGKSSRKLGLEQIDLLILHQPLTADFERTQGAYRALETLLADGRVRAIGISNFMPDDIEKLMGTAKVAPAVNQIEVHPYFQQPEVQRLNREHCILTQAWAPLGGITFYRPGFVKSTMDEPVILELGRKYSKSAAQVMLRWGIQEGRSVIPKSVKPARIAENFAVFDFALTADEIAAIDALDTGVRGGPVPASITPQTFKREIPEN